MENITFCHFGNSIFDKIKSQLQKTLGCQGNIIMRHDTRNLPRDPEAIKGEDDPDKYLEDEIGKKVLVEFKVGGRDSRTNIADQLARYYRGFKLPIVLITCWKWSPSDFDSLLLGTGLTRNQNLFFFNYRIQDILELALTTLGRDGVDHARFRKADDAYFLTKPGTAETRTVGLCWSVKHRELYLPVCGLDEGRDPVDGPFTTSQRNSTYLRSLRTNNARALDKYEERIKYTVNRKSKVEMLWPRKGLLELQ